MAANTWATYGKSISDPALRSQLSRQLEGALVELVVTLAESRISTGDLLGLRVGDIITTDKDMHEPLDVAVQGASKFNATVGAFKGRKAIRVESQP